MIRTLIFLLTLPLAARSAEPENEIKFYSGIDMHYCTVDHGNGVGCYTSTFGYEWWSVKLALVDQPYSYWTGKAEQHREFRGKSYTATIFLEEWRDPFFTNKITVTIAEDGRPESTSRVSFSVKDLHDFIHFDLEGMETSTTEGPQRAILSFGPEYGPPPGSR